MLSGEVGRKIPTARLGGKETDVATDTAKLLAERFRNIRQDWDLRADVSTFQAQNKALAPLHAWLRRGEDDPEVVIRAVQVLMADPERPGIHKRLAVNHVFKQVSDAWENAGLDEQDVHILRGMILATWPYELTSGGLGLVPLLDSTWMAISSRLSRDKQFAEWRKHIVSPGDQRHSSLTAHHKVSGTSSLGTPFADIEVSDYSEKLTELEGLRSNYMGNLPAHIAKLISEQRDDIEALTDRLNEVSNALAQINSHFVTLSEQTNKTKVHVPALSSQLDLLWWGQSRYSRATQLPYRRISDTTQRMWWMAWECSELATNLEVEPAASFLIETLYQLDAKADDPKRPLKSWVTEFIAALRLINENELHANAMGMSSRLEKLAKEDPLGLPVTWARIKAAERKPSEESIEEQLREQLGVDPETQLDRGDWLSWMFRESLLDRHLQDGED
jgi:hypothetical protein